MYLHLTAAQIPNAAVSNATKLSLHTRFMNLSHRQLTAAASSLPGADSLYCWDAMMLVRLQPERSL